MPLPTDFIPARAESTQLAAAVGKQVIAPGFPVFAIQIDNYSSNFAYITTQIRPGVWVSPYTTGLLYNLYPSTNTIEIDQQTTGPQGQAAPSIPTNFIQVFNGINITYYDIPQTPAIGNSLVPALVDVNEKYINNALLETYYGTLLTGSGTNTQFVISIPAPPSGQYIYLTHLRIERFGATFGGTISSPDTYTILNPAITFTNFTTLASINVTGLIPASAYIIDTDKIFYPPLRSTVIATGGSITVPAMGTGVTAFAELNYYYGS